MENASEALLMAFGILIFILALTVAINSFSQVRAISDVVLYASDSSNYYEYEVLEGQEKRFEDENRIVRIRNNYPSFI